MTQIQRILRGIEILSKYTEVTSLEPGHDQIWVDGPEYMDPEDNEDAAELVSLNWFWDDDVDSWSMFT